MFRGRHAASRTIGSDRLGNPPITGIVGQVDLLQGDAACREVGDTHQSIAMVIVEDAIGVGFEIGTASQVSFAIIRVFVDTVR